MSNNSKLFNKDGKEYHISSPFGMRSLSVNGKDISGYHIGTDYLFPQGTELVLPVDVEIIGVNTGHGDYGGHVFAYNKHFNGTFNPAHMSRIDVKKGDVVKAGTVIGLSGGAKGTVGAGLSTGAHLHIGWYAKGKKTNTGKGTWGDGQWVNIANFDFTIKPKPITDPYKYKKGDKVTFSGNVYGNSDGGGTGKSYSNKSVTVDFNAYEVTKGVKTNATHPIHVGGLGWIKESQIGSKPTPTKYEPKVGDYVVPTELKDFQGRKLTQFDKLYQVTAKDSRGYTLSAVRKNLRPIWAIMPKGNFKESK